MNVAIGSVAVLVGVVIAACAIGVLLVGIINGRRDLLRTPPLFAGLLLASALVACAKYGRIIVTVQLGGL